MNSIFTRRSIREYDSRPVEPEKLDRTLRAGMQAPSAMNRQPWEFLVVEKPEMIQKIAAKAIAIVRPPKVYQRCSGSSQAQEIHP